MYGEEGGKRRVFLLFQITQKKKKDKKGTKSSSRQFIKQDIQMGDRHIKRCSVPVIIMGVKNKTSYSLSFMRQIHI